MVRARKLVGIASFGALMLLTLLTPGSILAGTQAASQIVSVVPRASASRGIIATYQVQDGDSLSGIADLLAVDVETLRNLNDIADVNSIKVGQILDVPDLPTQPA